MSSYRKTLTAVSAAFLAIAAAAETVVYDGVTYTVEDATVSPARVCVGTNTDGVPAVDAYGELTLEIPGSFTVGGKTYTVARIGEFAFKGCGNLKGVVIPATVTSIGKSAFQYSGLTSVVIPGSIESIGGDYCFDSCGSLEEVVIEDGVRIVDRYAFRYCSKLKKVVFPGSISRIRDAAFRQTAITDLVLPPKVTNLEYGVFSRCYSLTNLVLHSNVRYIGADGAGAFSECTSLTEVTIPDSVASISAPAFDGCRNLSRVTVPQLVVDSGLTNVFRSAAASIVDVTLSGNATAVSAHTFEGCVNLRRIVIPDSVTSIAEGAFDGLTELEEVTIPPNVAGLNAATFSGCDKLWSRWYRALSDGAYDLSGAIGDKKIASLSVSGDASLDDFVLRDGKVYDALVVVENKASNAVTLTLPGGFRYVAPAGKKPLSLPAKSLNLLTITRVSNDTFLVTRQKLQEID